LLKVREVQAPVLQLNVRTFPEPVDVEVGVGVGMGVGVALPPALLTTANVAFAELIMSWNVKEQFPSFAPEVTLKVGGTVPGVGVGFGSGEGCAVAIKCDVHVSPTIVTFS
jgi:hypothetical protein